jgi:hypothetical protein
MPPVAFESLEAAARRAETLSPGPSSVQGLFAWPEDLAAALAGDPGRRAQLLSLVSKGVEVYSDYSGYASEKEALTVGWEGLRRGWDLKDDFVRCPFSFRRACDIGLCPQTVLCSMSKNGGDFCVFENVLERLVPVANQWVQQALPMPTASREQAMSAYTTIQQWLIDNRSWILPGDYMQYCMVHETECFVHPLGKLHQQRQQRGSLAKRRRGEGSEGASAY